jgi:hypothetical protein
VDFAVGLTLEQRDLCVNAVISVDTKKREHLASIFPDREYVIFNRCC